MAYYIIKNGCWEGYYRCRWDKLGRNGSCQASSAIDERGRLFTWGQNYWGQAGQGDWNVDGRLREIEFTAQLTNAENWIKVTSGEVGSMALNDEGALWAWGDDYGDGSQWGLPSGTAPAQARIPIRCAPGQLFKDVAFAYYYTLAIGEDDKLYTFGPNDYWTLGIGGVDGANYHTPVVNPYITKDVKLIDAELFSNVAVTVDNEVYVFGCDWWYTDNVWETYDTGVPWQVTGLPVGANIVDAKVNNYGVVVVLDDGTVWKAGSDFLLVDGTGTGSGTDNFVQVTEFAPHFVTKVSTSGIGSPSLVVVTASGDLYGYMDETSWNWSGNAIAMVWDQQQLIGAEFAGNSNYVDVSLNTHNQVIHAIDGDGWLWAWGTQWWGSHLAIGKKSISANGTLDLDDYEVVAAVTVPTKCAPGLDYNGNLAYVNNLADNTSPYLHTIPQADWHLPCGHWHLRLFEGYPTFPNNCWMPSVDADDGNILMVASGKHLRLGSEEGAEVIFFLFSPDHHTWTELNRSELRYAADSPGGAAMDSGIYAYLNYKADISGNRINEFFSNYAMGCWVVDGSGNLNYTQWADSIYHSGVNKIGVYTGGHVVIAYEDTGGTIRVKYSSDYGATWNTIKSQAANGDFSVIVNSSGAIYFAYQVSSSAVTIEKSTNWGVGWSTITTGNSVISSMNYVKMISDNAMLYLICASSSAVAVERSSNDGGSWGTISGEPTTHHTGYASGVSDGQSDITIVLSQENIYRYSYSPLAARYQWEQLADSNVQTANDTMEGDDGTFVYGAFTLVSLDQGANNAYVSLAISRDNGAHWRLYPSPLRFFGNGPEITEFEGDPLFYRTQVPYLEPDKFMNLERDDWATTFVRQEDKY